MTEGTQGIYGLVVEVVVEVGRLECFHLPGNGALHSVCLGTGDIWDPHSGYMGSHRGYMGSMQIGL